MSLFRWIAGSQIRLALATLLGIALCALTAPPAAQFIRYDSASPVANMFIKLGVAAAILASATLLAILIGDRVFPGRWRERVILGRHVAPVAPDDTMEAVKGLRSYYLQFSILIVALCVAGGFAIDRATQLFSEDEYTRTTLRGDDVERKLAIVDELAGARTEQQVRSARELLETVWQDQRQPMEIREASLQGLASVVEYLEQAIETWRSEGRSESWQGSLLLELRGSFAAELRAAHATAPAPLRPHLTYLLGALQDVQANPLIEAEIAAFPDDSSKPWQAAVAALGAARQSRLLPVVTGLLRADRADVPYALVAWATKEAVRAFYRAHPEMDRAPEAETTAITHAVDFFTAELRGATLERRCIAAELLRFTGHLAAREPLLAAFDAPESQGPCGQVRAELPSEGDAWIGSVDETLQARVVQAIATISQGDPTIGAWIRARVATGGYDETVTALLAELAKQK